jgi:hypothetical protein
MAQKTDLNISPYYDDFDSAKNFYKVLFNPGRPVQARELTTLQSILQNQVESFGSHIFKEGSVVIPGNIAYDGQFYSVKVNSTTFGVDISLYINNFIGKKIVGQISGTTATIQYIAFPDNINVEYLTIYVKYLDSDNNFKFNPFVDGESLIAEENVTYGNTTINAGTPFASLISLNATSIGSAAFIGDGVYFIRGYFVNVSKQTLILDNYTNTPSYRVGLKIDELITSAKDDNSLYDNAKGFTNFAAPGADRFKINLTLTKKLLSDTNDTDFVELLRVQDGKIKKIDTKTSYNLIRDYLAERTYDESGDYAVQPFNPSAHNSLNNRLGNSGLFFDNEKTDQGNVPSDDLMCIKVSPGKAYVRGYDVENISTSILDVEKPRDTQSVSNVNIPFEMGNIIRVNNVSGAPAQRYTLGLYSQFGGLGTKIGDARVYTFNLTDAAYTGASTNWDLSLYDIQTYTSLVLNSTISSTELPATSFVKGRSSGASGYAVSAGGGSSTITLSQTSGTFSVGEQLIVNGIDFPRTITTLKSFGTQEIKSVKQSGISGYPTFTANCQLEKFLLPNGIVEASINGGNTVTSSGKVFTGIKTDTIIRYQTTSGDETYNRVSAVASDGLSLTIAAVTPNISGVYTGGITTGIYPITIGAPIIRNQDSGYLYAELSNSNISSVNLSDSLLTVSEQLTGQTISGNQLTIQTSDFTGITSAFFAAFDEERYSIHYTGGGIGTVTSDSFSLNSATNEVTFSGLTNGSNAVVNATLIKNGIQSKLKQYTRSQTINVNLSKYTQSGSGISSSINDGLAYNQYYGLRVQDEQISLNYPDVAKVLAIYESLDKLNPVLDQVEFTATANVSANAIIGENIIGNTTKAIARVVTLISTNILGIVYLNTDRFLDGESVSFEESNITTDIQSITAGKYKDITNSYSLDKGQKDQYYDYSRIVRNNNSSVPSKRLLIVFDYYAVPSTDSGDVFTVLSYDKERFLEDVPYIGPRRIRSSDTLDFRPRVSVFTSTSSSPFDFSSRNFNTVPRLLLSPNESSLVGYDYYLGRIDKLYLDKFGTLILQKGVSAITPKSPTNNDDVMEIATITLPPYLYDPTDVEISLVDNRRYTMRDIGLIEDRVENLERVTSLSLLEVNTQTLQIQDADGRNRFKSGFFVDDFKNTSLINSDFSSIQIDSEAQELIPIISKNTLKSQLAPAASTIDEELDLSTNFQLLDPNVQKTGEVVTLKYDSIGWIEQPLATRVENVNPFHVVVYTGSVKLSPASDSWIRTIRLPDKNINGGTITTGNTGGRLQSIAYDVQSNDILVDSGNELWMRSRNTEFSVTNIKPLTQFYQFFDGNGSVDFIPKLVEIANDSTLQNYGASNAFIAGETVIGSYGGSNLINFRVATANHKYGQYNSPSTTFNINPYVKTENLASSYSASSKVLNIDTYSLSQEAQGKYSGYLVTGMKLVGQQSGAVAYVKNLRLISDNYGDLIGSFFLRDPNTVPAPTVRISTGTKTFKVTNSSTNAAPLPGSNLISSAETSYKSEGVFEVKQLVTTTTTIMRYVDPLAQSFSVGGNIEAPSPIGTNDDENGAFLTAVDLFFANKDSNNNPVRVEIRTVELGTPTRVVIGNPVTLRPDDITISTTGEIATKVTFDYPIYLSPGNEYAIVIISEASDQYELWTAQMGEKTVNTQSLPDAESVRYTKQFALGSLFKSQNGSIWTANQYQDLKFKLYKAQFTSSTGTAFFYNPTLDESNGYVQKLNNNPLVTLPKTATLGITTTTNASLISILSNGRKIAGSQSYVYGYVVGTGSSVSTGGLTLTTDGKNYVTDSSVGTYNIVGNGSGLVLNISATNGAITGTPTIVSPGNGYAVGDVVGIVTSDVSSRTGSDARITISAISGVDTLYLSGVQGSTFTTGIGVSYYNDAGTLVSVASTTIRSFSQPNNQYSGNYIRVSHFDHGMYGNTNKITIKDCQSSTAPSILSATLTAAEASIISIGDTSNFGTFEGVNVSVNNPGYVKIENEIISYTSVGSGTLSIAASGRGIDSTRILKYDSNTSVYKYELNGISLRRINTTHDISDLDIDMDGYYLQIDRSINGVDRDTDGNPSNMPELSFTNEASLGGSNVRATENIQYSALTPNYNIITPGNATSATATIRTVTGTSVDGNETSFLDNGFESVELNKLNVLNSTRIVCSKQNENTYLTNLPRNKSFTTGVTLNTTNINLSPIIYTDTAFTEFRASRLNNPISDYASDNRVNSLIYDPHASAYVSNTVNLTNPAKSLKVILSAYRHASADFRVLYNLIRADSSEVSQEFELFPGYDNLAYTTADGYSVIDSSKNSGRPDTFVSASLDNQFLEYQFTADNLDLFTGYTIKIVMSGTNQAYPPRIKELRTLAIR